MSKIREQCLLEWNPELHEMRELISKIDHLRKELARLREGVREAMREASITGI